MENNEYKELEKRVVIGEINDKLIFQNIGLILDTQKEAKSILYEMNKKLEEQISYQTDVEWLKKTYWLIVTMTVGSLGTAIFSLILK